MDAKLFSSTLSPYQGKITNDQLRSSLNQLHKAIGKTLTVYSWDEFYIAVTLKLTIEVPPLGTHQGVDIRGVEPVVLVFSLSEYPTEAPLVYTDRLDFPKDRLAHLYIAQKGKPPAFCYVRGNRDEWYANKRIEDLLLRISNWLQDAATGELTVDGNQFDPLRLEGYVGVSIYDYDEIAQLVISNQVLFPREHYAIGLFELVTDGFRLVKILTLENYKEIGDDIAKDSTRSDTDPNRKRYRFGYFLWSERTDVYANYEIDFPENWFQFKALCVQFGVAYEAFEKFYVQYDSSGFIIFPVTIAVKRPKPLIGFLSTIEFLNFRFSIDSTDVVDGQIADDVSVKLTAHNQPLTTLKARTIAGVSANHPLKAIVFGCGALGSKICMHVARAGLTNLVLVDPDELSPHNLVRHALLSEYEGQNKASAVAGAIKKLFPTEELNILHSPSSNRVFNSTPLFFESVWNWVFDFTASEAFFVKLTLTDALTQMNVASAYISDFGQMGVLLREGPNRNPRIDDLKVELYSRYKSQPAIRAWLKREQEASATSNLTVTVGVGCNSETTILPDEKVSVHAAIVAGELKRQTKEPHATDRGGIFLSMIDTQGRFAVQTKEFAVRPYDMLSAVNDDSWSVRFKYDLLDRIKKQMKKAGKNETGGVFVGVANYKTKTIHVIDLIPAPPDSQANRVCFFRGYEGLPKQISEVTVGSGGQLGYIGEWHSHPDGPNGPSITDLHSVHRFKTEFETLMPPLPVFLTIITPDAILPYVF